MDGASKAESGPSHQPKSSKLRASCDTCFLAKVKCSKARPICSRCLACGADCRYSPSSRAGKPKSARRPTPLPSTSSARAESAGPYPTPAMSIDLEPPTSYGMETDWAAVLGSPGEGLHCAPIASTGVRDETGSEPEANPELFDPIFPWTTSPRSELPSPYMSAVEQHQSQHHQPHAPPGPRDQHLHRHQQGPCQQRHQQQRYQQQQPPGQQQQQQQQQQQHHNHHHHHQHQHLPQYQPQSGSKFSPGPVSIMPHPPDAWYQASGHCTPASPHSIYVPPSHDSSPRPLSRSASCNCFDICLAALQALHTSDTQPASSAFDVILTTNQRAVEACARMLACPRCTARSSASSLRTMLLGTILSRIIAIYQEASTSYFARASHQLPLSFGSYHVVAGEDVRWLQAEIILRDLEKLKELFARFRDAGAAGEREEDIGMHDAVSHYLCQSLDLTLAGLRKQRGFPGGAMNCEL
ncbi:hypothetical protein PZA11_007074 [Diplocarpon coronariae]